MPSQDFLLPLLLGQQFDSTNALASMAFGGGGGGGGLGLSRSDLLSSDPTIRAFQDQFEHPRNLLDPATNLEAQGEFAQLLKSLGSDFHTLRDEIGPVRLGHRMREVLGRDDPEAGFTGRVNLGNGIILDVPTGQIGPFGSGGRQSSSGSMRSASGLLSPSQGSSAGGFANMDNGLRQQLIARILGGLLNG